MAIGTFQDRVCVVTGGASGLGRALCEDLARRGAIVVVADLRAQEAGQVAATLAGDGRHEAVGLDVTDAHAFGAALRDVKRRRGRLDLLFNNAGTTVVGKVRTLELEHWQRVLDVNLQGVIHGIHHAYRIMLEQGSGHIVNIASGYGLAPGGLNAPYTASKFAVVGLTEALRHEAAGLGIDVTCVCPGWVRTPLTDSPPSIGMDGGQAIRRLRMPLMSPPQAARRILHGVARRQGLLAFPFYVRGLGLLWHLWPDLYALGLQRFVAANRRRRA